MEFSRYELYDLLNRHRDVGEYLWLVGADLSGANLNGAILKFAIYNRMTKWPEGFNPKAAGAILR